MADHAVLQEGRLGDGVDGAAGGAAAEHQARRTLQHLHFLIVETVAGIGGKVAQSVQIDVVLGVEAAYLELVAGQRAPLADSDCDARHVAQRIAERGRRLLLHCFCINHADRLGRVLQAGEGHGRHRRAVSQRIPLAGPFHGHRAQYDRGGLLRICGRAHQHGAQKAGGGAGKRPVSSIGDNGRHE